MALDHLSPIGLSLLLLLIIIIIKKIIKIAFNTQKTRNHPPSPPKLPIIGNLHQLGHLPHQSLFELSKRHGPVMLLHLGSMPTLVLSSAEAAKEALKSHDLECCSRPPLAGTGRLSFGFLDIAFAPYGDYWREVRKLCTLKLFSASKVGSFRFVREEEVAMLVESIARSASRSCAPVDLSGEFMSLTANIVCRMAFGKSFVGSEVSRVKFVEMMHEAMAMLGSFSASDFFPRVGWIVDRITGFTGRLERNFRDLDRLYQQVIDHHLDPNRANINEQEEDLVDMLLKLQNEDHGSSLRLTQTHIKAIIVDIFLGGMDTGATTMVWTMTELAKNPRVMKKARDEIRRLVGDKGRVEESDLEQLQYLKMVVKETFRLHPPSVLLIPRLTMSPFKINGYNIDANTRININAWAMGRDPSLWEKPLEFFPERFQDSPIDYKGQHFELLPFGAGRRGCPAMSLGMFMVELGLANVLYAFDWKLPEGMKEEDIDMGEEAALVVNKKIPLKLVPMISLE